MSEHFNEQISEFVDDEMSPEECEFFVRRLQNDVEARARFLRYQVIGAAVRGEHLRQARPQAARRPMPAAAGLAVGAGIAACAAVLAIVAFRLAGAGLSGPRLDDAAAAAATAESAPSPAPDTAAAAPPAAGPPPYVVPAAATEPQQFVGGSSRVTGLQYLIHHTGYSSGVSRTIMHSSLLTGPEVDVSTETEAH